MHEAAQHDFCSRAERSGAQNRDAISSPGFFYSAHMAAAAALQQSAELHVWLKPEKLEQHQTKEDDKMEGGIEGRRRRSGADSLSTRLFASIHLSVLCLVSPPERLLLTSSSSSLSPFFTAFLHPSRCPSHLPSSVSLPQPVSPFLFLLDRL